MALSKTTPAPAATTRDSLEIVAMLRESIGGTVDAGTRRRAEYSTDASNYRVVPDVVVFPRDTDDVLAIADVSRATSTPLTMRGGGTSVAGNSIGPGIVVDLSRSVNRLIDIDPDARTATVEPGIVLGSLQKSAAAYGLRFGPDPSTWARCTIGGMIGNNACGSHSLAFGRTSDNLTELDMIDGTGRRFTAGRGLDAVPGLDDFVSKNLGLFRTELGQFGRQVSGYSLEHLLPEKGRNLAAAMVGTEGTCGVVLGAKLSLVDMPIAPLLLVLGYPDMFAAADAVPAILQHRPGAIEGLDARLVDVVRRNKGDDAVSNLPAGGGWLLVELSGIDPAETVNRAEILALESGAISSRIITSSAEAATVWRIREDGAGLGGRTASGKQTWPGFEDAAVPPENLGNYLREFDALLEQYGIEGAPYGHFGDGCIHIRLDIPLDQDGTVLRALMEDAAKLVASHGGSLSGEHGDGRARSQLLPLMYSEQSITAFSQFKNFFDPQNLLNPGVVVSPAPIDRDLRRPQALPIRSVNGLAFTHDDGDFTKAVHRCVGVGKCRTDNTANGGFMCPSYIATQDEKDSTRGRARVLQEMANGSLVARDWSAPEIHDALDLCLSCKACSSDCPAGVDMAAYKTEMLHQTYKGKLRPITHYVLGWLPRWARLASPLSRIINPILSVRWIEKIVLRLGGMDSRRAIPQFAATSFSTSQRRSRTVKRASPTDRRVLLWTDSFSDNFSPAIAHSAIELLEDAGYTVITPERPACCGLTWISTGQLDGARRILGRLMDDFHPFVEEGVPVLGLEPSCTAVLRSDLLELFPDDPRAEQIARGTYTVAELLSAPAPIGPVSTWSPPSLEGCEVVVQPHCHQHSVMGFSPDAKLLDDLGASVTPLAGCCGLAGNFGMEDGHYDVSVAVAENAMLPALRHAAPGTILLADGFSCRTQADQLADTQGMHLVELLASRLASKKV